MRHPQTRTAARTATALALCAFAGVASAARAAPSSRPTPRHAPAARPDSTSPDALAASLGVPNLANRKLSEDGRVLFREYIPAGERFDNWTRMLTVITVRVPDEREAGDAAVARWRAARYAELRGKGASAEGLFTRDDPARGPLLYGTFEIGAGAEREHCVTALRRGAPGVAAMFTFARRDRALAPKEVAAVAAVAGIPAEQVTR